jgi:signal transduction histidine kinase
VSSSPISANGRKTGRAWLQRQLPAPVVDRLLAATLLIWALFDVPWWWRPPGHRGSALAILGLLVLACSQSMPFLWRRTQPAAVLALAGASLTVKYAAHLNVWSASAAVLAAAYGLGAYGGRALRQATRVLAAAAVLAALVTLQAGGGDHSAAVACALLGLALVLGEVTSAHRDIATAAARHAHELERASLARELHDIVAHQLSAIAVQAGAARLASAQDPQAAPAAIATIEQEARDGLAELNSLVRALRQSGSADPGLPRLGDLPELVRRAGESGLQAELQVDGQPRPLVAAVELAGYRVVQESLTNAIRYAPGAAATVRLTYRADGIAVAVADDGPGPLTVTSGQGGGTGLAGHDERGQGGGTGLAGLGERARLLGGYLEAGAGPQGGFAVHAFLPDGTR